MVNEKQASAKAKKLGRGEEGVVDMKAKKDAKGGTPMRR